MLAFYGKYRGKVTRNSDPMRLGRVEVEVPATLGNGRGWAMPCVPYAGPQVGFLALPPVGANVWVEFEGGDLNYPIWSGCFWGQGELPIAALKPEIIVFKAEGVTVTMSDAAPAKGFTVEVGPPVAPQPLKLEMNDNGITIGNGQTKLTIKAQELELNNGAGSATLASDSIEVKQATASVKLSASGVEAGSGPAKISVASASIELSNVGSNLKLLPASVNVNNGALEVM